MKSSLGDLYKFHILEIIYASMPLYHYVCVINNLEIIFYHNGLEIICYVFILVPLIFSPNKPCMLFVRLLSDCYISALQIKKLGSLWSAFSSHLNLRVTYINSAVELKLFFLFCMHRMAYVIWNVRWIRENEFFL